MHLHSMVLSTSEETHQSSGVLTSTTGAWTLEIAFDSMALPGKLKKGTEGMN